MGNNKRCPNNLHDFVPIIEGGETVGLICIIDGCGFSVREDMERSSLKVLPDGRIIMSETLFDGGSHRGQKGGRF